jgi:peptidoglycan/xylan/chitin deacetylase (PgdA/CDA1 family)
MAFGIYLRSAVATVPKGEVQQPAPRQSESFDWGEEYPLGRPAVLTYHEIEPEPSSDLYRISRDELERHLQLVAELRHARRPLASPPVVTFDDGHESNFRYAPLLLAKYGCRAIFFITAGFIESHPTSMTWSQVRELASLGHEVQSHSWSHRCLTHCSPVDLREQLQRSRETIEERIGMPVDAISIPYGRWNPRVLEACAKSGYRRVYTSDPWLPPAEREGVDVRGRLTIRNTIRPEDLRRLLTMHGLPLRLQQAKYQFKQTVKRILGDRIYHRLWTRFVGRDEPAEMN